MIIAVTGGRDFVNRKLISDTLDSYPNITQLWHGGCPTGVDRYADIWAALNDIPTRIFTADWETHGRAAGPRRNREMMLAKPDLLLVFPGGRGTANCRLCAGQLKVPMEIING
jgi:hypothetical protein